jgi:hypothetical protein
LRPPNSSLTLSTSTSLMVAPMYLQHNSSSYWARQGQHTWLEADVCTGEWVSWAWPSGTDASQYLGTGGWQPKGYMVDSCFDSGHVNLLLLLLLLLLPRPAALSGKQQNRPLYNQLSGSHFFQQRKRW